MKIKFLGSEFIKKLDATLTTYNVAGLKVCYIEKECNEFAFNLVVYNKLSDNKGLAHMVEHCIFGGSLNYNIKEPFEMLVQEKKYTYLNGITYRDRTVYPFSTYDEMHFDEIFDVYTDAVFNPLNEIETFEQECIRKEGDNFNGIVYNEMQQMFADDEYKLENDLLKMFDCECLKYNSAGEPEQIKTTTYDDVINYYNENYACENMVVFFYGQLEQEKYNNLLLDKLANREEADVLEKRQSTFIDIKSKVDENHANIIFAFECETDKKEEVYKIFFEYTILNEQSTLKKIYGTKYEIKTWASYDLKTSLVFVCVKKLEHTGTDIDTESIVMSLIQDIGNLDYNLINDIVIKKDYAEKNKDYGYKTQGVYNLIEISKRNCNFYDYYNVSEYKCYASIIQDIFLEINYKICTFFNRDFKNIKKNINKDFLKNENCDIIDMIVIISFGVQKTKMLNIPTDFFVNNCFFMNDEFVKDVYAKKINIGTKSEYGFYIHLSCFASNKEKCLKQIKAKLKSANLNDLIIENKNIIKNDIHSLIDYCVGYDKKNYLFYEKIQLTFDYYIYDDKNKNIFYHSSNKIDRKQNIMFGQKESYIELEENKGLNKNILVLTLQDTADYMYLELILEVLLNEVFIKKIRLENGAYEVGYKLFKLENKVVLYSNIDINTHITLDIFKTELKNLKKINKDDLVKYINKITNNFYKNEQNKSKNIYKKFENYLLNIQDSLDEINISKANYAIEVLRNSKVSGEFSFGNKA